MTVKELRDALAELPADALVLVSGYEGDWDIAGKPALVTAYDHGEAAKKEEWWKGRYSDDSYEGCEALQAVVISR